MVVKRTKRPSCDRNLQNRVRPIAFANRSGYRRLSALRGGCPLLHTEDNRSDELISGLRSQDPERVNAAMSNLKRETVLKARARLGASGRHVNLDPDSVAMSVLLGEVVCDLDRIKNDAQLLGRIAIAVRHKIIDRRKSPRAKEVHGIPEGASGPVPTEAASEELELAGRVREALEQGLDADDRAILHACVLGDEANQHAANKIGISAPALRKRLERMRPMLRQRLVLLTVPRLTPEERRLTELLLVERLTPQACARNLGIDDAELKARIRDLFAERIEPSLGLLGQFALLRLLGQERDQ